MSTPAAIGVSVAITIAIGAAVWTVQMVLENRRSQDEHARKTMAARQAHLDATRADGTREACDLTDKQELVWERYAGRYETFGQDALQQLGGR